MTPAAQPLQRPGLWLILLALGLLATLIAVRLVFLVEPGLNVDITLSRQQALEAATEFRQQRFPALAAERSAAVFISDREFQNYIELEAGGSTAYEALVTTPAAVTHSWRVRAFSPGRKPELLTSFSPQGRLTGFQYLLPEDEGSVALDAASARALAETGARDLLGEDFAAYQHIASRLESQSNGRLDHTFTYEHGSLQPGAARLRLNLQVAGDQLVALTHEKFTPEAFRQRFGELRTLNTQLSQLATGLMLGVFGLGGLVGGGIWLYRRHLLQYRRALRPALFIGAGLAAARIASMPTLWMGYQTQTTAQSFILQVLMQTALTGLAATLLFAAIFAVAEGLARQAQPQQPQLWRSLQTPVAASRALAGRVLGSYVWTGLFLLYALGFLWFSARVLGWWQPASLEVDPNVLASWRPALAPIFNALQAGTWEECLFRAIPLSIAVLLDRRFGTGRRLTLAMLLFQALVFGAAHANYPQLPGYSRVVELFVPALVFGLVFLRFGLLPCMLTHFLYDLLLMSMPIFIARDSGLLLDRLLVLAAAAAPLLVLVRAWRVQGALGSLPAGASNAAAQAADPVPPAASGGPADTPTGSPGDSAPASPDPAPALPARAVRGPALTLPAPLRLVLGCAGIALLGALLLRPPALAWPGISLDRAAALQRADTLLAERGIVPDAGWRRSAQLRAVSGAALRMVWEQSGAAATQALLGKQLEAPHWIITWRRFEGPVEERAERWQLRLDGQGELLALEHQLPEGRPGASLDRTAAEALARDSLATLGWDRSGGLRLHSIAETRRPARSDWEVRFEDPGVYQQDGAVALATVQIAGTEVSGYYRSIDVPEAWARASASADSRRQGFRLAGTVLSLALFGCALASWFGRSSGRRFVLGNALPWLVLALIPQAGLAWLRFDTTSMTFQTSMPWDTQVQIQIGGQLIGAALLGVLIVLASQAIHTERPAAGSGWRQDLQLGSSLALGAMGLFALGILLLPAQQPPPPMVADWGTPAPLLAAVLNAVRAVVGTLLILILTLGFVRFGHSPGRRVLLVSMGVLYWLCQGLAALQPSMALVASLPMLATIALGYVLIRRGQLGAALVLAGTVVMLRQWNLVLLQTPQAWLQASLAFAASAAAVYGLLWHWHRCQPPD